MPDNTQLKWPSGEFTHTEFAQFNNRTNQSVWSVWSESRKNGILISAGERKNAGKGKPSLLFKVNPNPPVPAVVVAAAKAAGTPKPAKTVKTPKTPKVKADVVVPTEPVTVAAVESAMVPVVTIEPPALPAVEPVTAPPVAEAILEVAANVEPVVNTVKFNSVTISNPHPITETCPVCKNPLMAGDDATGVMVWCSQNAEVCQTTENPFGHGKTQRIAYEVLVSRWENQNGR